MNLEDSMLRERSQTQEDRHCMTTESKRVEPIDTEGKKVIARGCREQARGRYH